MLLRALLVFLVVINLGVAAWWALRAPVPPLPPVQVPAGVPKLQLLSEAPPRALQRPAAAIAPKPAPPTQCFSFGPYANPALLRRAVERVRATGASAQIREQLNGKPSGWRVFLPAQATPEATRALADRIGAAGIDDYLLLPEGNGIALGRFGTEAAAQRRQSTLTDAGFPAQIAPLGDVVRESWIDARGSAGLDGARMAQDIGAARAQPLDCARLSSAAAAQVVR
jgi:hypothetical protein